MSMIRAFFILIFAVFIAAPPAMAAEKEYNISDAYGWFTRYSNLTDADIKVLITKDSIIIFYEGPSDWVKRRGNFKKLGKNLFVLAPEEMIDSTEADILSKAPCPIYKVKFWQYGYGNRPAVSLDSYPSMEGMRAGKVCYGISYIPITPPFDWPAN